MKTFLTAIAILLVLILLMLGYSRWLVRETEGWMAAAEALPTAGEAGCLSAVVELEERWQRGRRIAGLAVDTCTLEAMDRAMIALREAARAGETVEFEISRAQLIASWEELRALMRCELWSVV